MPPKDPHVVLGIEPGAAPDDIKAAWRSLARRHHPDLTGDDPETARRATRRMAEINAAYAALTRAGETIEGQRAGSADGRTGSGRSARGGAGFGQEDAYGRGQGAYTGAGTAGTRDGRPGGPPAPPRTRPVTGRLDLSGTVRPRNQTITPPGTRIPLTGQPPLRHDRSRPELRASQPSGTPEIRRDPDYVPPTAPSLEDALDIELDFGKFHGHTLGEVAAFEPSYIDWLAATVARDPEVTMAARVIRSELDRQGIVRAQRPSRPGWQSNPFR
ncbi:MAG TPA: DnaJ domain-containing protein [Candidatus Limnocylindrales bacterium]|nr:DnaJ domain-containing protein [Candidatus Limnocylindrales bacterium]